MILILKVVSIEDARISKVNPKYAEHNLGDSDLELVYNDNTVIKVEHQESEIIEYPEDTRFPPHWKNFSDICREKFWEKNLGIM